MAKRERGPNWWNGGHIHRQSDGRELFIIERQVGKTRYHVSTGAHTWKAALEQLERFEAAPRLYEKGGGIGAEAPLRLSEALIIEFLQWQAPRVSAQHHYYTGRYLQAWREDLNGFDLRRLRLAELHEALDKRRTCRPKRIAAIKVFCTWLRTVKDKLTSANDATLRLPVPQASPEQRRLVKAVSLADIRRALKVLREEARDCLLVMASTGIHESELKRFAKGRGELRGLDLSVWHKGDDWHTVRLPAKVAAAAKRIQKREKFPAKLSREFKAAGGFTAGQIRHTVATWAKERGASMQQIADQLGHRDPRTTRRNYADLRVAAPVVKLPRL